ncbi:MAG: hypothetical protein NTW86_08095 [Candidatus Sumerlaeota bacterium]|nr:hypothetical protein [Candidatus Sumerlaeota bacterium]
MQTLRTLCALHTLDALRTIGVVGRVLRRRALALGALALLPLAIGQVGATQIETLDLENLSRLADAIVIGRVKSKEAVFEDGVIQTRYKFEANQYLKGNLGDILDLTQVGGEITGPIPMRQRLGGAVELFPGEKALLFLEMKNTSPAVQRLRQAARERIAAEQQQALAAGQPSQVRPLPREDSPLLTTPLIVGAWQGRYTIYTDEKGAEVATQLKADLGGLDATESTLKALGRIAQARAAESQPAASQPAGELTAEGETQFIPPGVLRVNPQGLDDLKTQIRAYVDQQKKDGLRRAPKPDEPRKAFPASE